MRYQRCGGKAPRGTGPGPPRERSSPEAMPIETPHPDASASDASASDASAPDEPAGAATGRAGTDRSATDRGAADGGATDRDAADPRRRLLRGIAAAVAEKGYAATTIADVVARAHVSKRTFYEHFADKQACYLEAYRRGTDRLGRRMLEAGTAAEGPWRERLRAAVAAYLRVLVDAPASTRTFTSEIQAAGPAALAARRAMHRRTAEALTAVVDDVRQGEPGLRPLRPLVADALVGAMTELVQNAVAEGDTAGIAALEAPILELLCGVLVAPPASREGPPDR